MKRNILTVVSFVMALMLSSVAKADEPQSVTDAMYNAWFASQSASYWNEMHDIVYTDYLACLESCQCGLAIMGSSHEAYAWLYEDVIDSVAYVDQANITEWCVGDELYHDGLGYYALALIHQGNSEWAECITAANTAYDKFEEASGCFSSAASTIAQQLVILQGLESTIWAFANE